VYRYPFTLPPGRHGMTPDLALTYNSQNTQDGSLVGFGWNLSIPFIERDNRTGLDALYVSSFFSSSFDGRLSQIDTTHYEPMDAGPRFSTYQLQSGYWTMHTRDGVTYSFGTTQASQQYDTTDPSKVFRWYLARIEDGNGNRIDYSYSPDQGQL